MIAQVALAASSDITGFDYSDLAFRFPPDLEIAKEGRQLRCKINHEQGFE